jgi:hypothetical protein
MKPLNINGLATGYLKKEPRTIGHNNMANQYTGSLQSMIEEKYKKPVNEVLQSFCDDGMTVIEVAQLLSFNKSTIRKYAKRFNIIFNKETQHENKKNTFWDEFYQSKLNEFNVLSRRW